MCAQLNWSKSNPRSITLPIFGTYDIGRLNLVSQIVFDLFENEDGLDALFGLVRDILSERLHETAYALCCDVAAADGMIFETELRLLEEMRYRTEYRSPACGCD